MARDGDHGTTARRPRRWLPGAPPWPASTPTKSVSPPCSDWSAPTSTPIPAARTAAGAPMTHSTACSLASSPAPGTALTGNGPLAAPRPSGAPGTPRKRFTPSRSRRQISRNGTNLPEVKAAGPVISLCSRRPAPTGCGSPRSSLTPPRRPRRARQVTSRSRAGRRRPALPPAGPAIPGRERCGAGGEPNTRTARSRNG